MTKPLPLDLASGHVTPVDGNVFEDLGFPSEEAERLLRQATKPMTDVEAEAVVRERYGTREIGDTREALKKALANVARKKRPGRGAE